MELPQISIYDILIDGSLFIIFIIVFLLGLAIKNKFRILIFILAFLIFIMLPFINITFIDNYINKVEFKNIDSKKLVYIDSYFINAELINKGKRRINECELNIYINKHYPFNPEYKLVLKDLKLNIGEKYILEKSIDNFKSENIKYIKIRCF
ncbi:DUF2393 family protein [Helicobacter sp. MIT 14-3879]|uniref:DUF2393 family protein n=1 Tax=Helicobacter sp. MIT 14-3879 TaxID=2040649 RepID=UPI0015F1B1E1|nr:DUF2393 family protein [Helicobacter sp. MIT 14-3879]